MSISDVDILNNNSACPKCGSPIFSVGGVMVSACVCGKLVDKTGSPMNVVNQITGDSPIEIIKEIVATECSNELGDLDSWASPVYAKAIAFLAKNNVCKIKEQKGFKIIAEWI